MLNRRLMLVAMLSLTLVASFAYAQRIMKRPKPGKWVGDNCELKLVEVKDEENPKFPFKGKLTLKSKTWDIKMECNDATGNIGHYEQDGEDKTFQFVNDTNTDSGTIKIADPYQEISVKWEKDDDKDKPSGN